MLLLVIFGIVHYWFTVNNNFSIIYGQYYSAPSSRPTTPIANLKNPLSREDQITKLELLVKQLQSFKRQELQTGIFRTSISATKLTEIVQSPTNDGIDKLTAEEASAAIKRMVRELDPPLISVQTQKDLEVLFKAQQDAKNDSENLTTKQATNAALKAELTQNSVLQKVADGLLHVIEDPMPGEENKINTRMSLNNLAIVAGPNFFINLETNDIVASSNIQNTLAEQLLAVRKDELIAEKETAIKENVNKNSALSANDMKVDMIDPGIETVQASIPPLKPTKVEVVEAAAEQHHNNEIEKPNPPVKTFNPYQGNRARSPRAIEKISGSMESSPSTSPQPSPQLVRRFSTNKTIEQEERQELGRANN